MFKQVGDAAAEYQQRHHDHQRGQERPALGREHLGHRRQRRRIARQLEQPEHAENAEEPKIDIDQKGEVERKDRQQVDQRHGGQHVTPATAEIAVWGLVRILHDDPNAGQVFDGEHKHRQVVEELEPETMHGG